MDNIYVITDDFIFKTKIGTVLKSINLSAEKYNCFHELDLTSINENPSLLVVDLENETLDFSNLKELKKTPTNKLYLLGYCSHVKRDLIEIALKSSFDEVMSR